MRIRGRGKMPALLLSIMFFFCISGAASAGHIQLNSYSIDVKGQEPTVPADLEPLVDGKFKKWIVQFTGSVQEADKKTLVDLGCRVGDYLPDFAFIVTMDNKTRKKVEKLSFVNGIVRYKPAYKIDKRLKNDSGEVLVEQGKKIRLIVKLDGKDNQSIVLSETHKKKGAVLDVSGDMVRVEVGQADITHFAQIEEVLWIEEAMDLQLLNDTSKWTIQTYVSGDTRIWDKGLHGEGQIVGIGDSGLDYDMPWFRDPAGTAIGPLHRKIVGYDTTYGDDYDSNTGHGTHVAGTVGGDRTPMDGLSNANGMAPKSRFFMQDITPAGNEPYVFPPSDVGLMFIKAYDAGARLHTNSWGGDGSTYNSMCMSADRFMWDHPDFLALFANGNTGSSTGTVGYPASAKNVVSVGATENGASAENVASFSSNGPTADGRIKPTVTAPGVAIISADSDGLKNSNNSGTIAMSGTSMATPTTAGAAALVRQYYTEGHYPSGTASSADAFIPSAALIKATLVNSAQNMIGNYTDASIPSTGQGWGRINLSNTLTFSGDTKTLTVINSTAGLATGDSISQTYFSQGDQPLKATLVWTDYPGTVGAAKALVNDLDLTVTAPDGGATYLGNVFSGGASATGGSTDRLNVEEQVLIATPAQGNYTVTVKGYNVPNGPQPFALVVTGASAVTSKGMLSLNKGRYNGSGNVVIRLSDLDLNRDTTAAEEVVVTVSSSSEPFGEQVRLVETGSDTAIFTGSISLSAAAPVAGDGIVEVTAGDTLTATYDDANDGTGSPATAKATSLIDMVPPSISAVSVLSVGESSSVVTWNTEEPANSSVNYGTTPDRGAVTSVAGLVTQHTLALSSLAEGRIYYFSVASTDEAGNTAVDDSGGSLYTFTTQNAPPSLTVYSSNGTATQAETTTVYGTAKDYSGIASVTVNGVPASYRSSDGYYELAVALVLGDNTFAVAATDGAGNVQRLTLTVKRLPQPDLTMVALADPESGVTGGEVTISNTVTAAPTGGNAGSFYVGIYLSTDATITTADTLLGLRYLTSLSAGEAIAHDTSALIPTSLKPGIYYLGAIADYKNSVIESDETNNVLLGGQFTVIGPDLTVSAVSGPASSGTNANIAISTTVAASASGGNAGSFDMNIYLSTDSTITTSDRKIGFRSFTGMAAGATSTADTVANIPVGIPPGTYYIGAIVDIYNWVTESDETNNSFVGNQITLVGPDLAMSAVSEPAQGGTNGTLTVTNTVSAAADAGNVTSFSVGFYLSTDATITTSDIKIGSRTVYNLSSGASSTEGSVVTIPATVLPGTYYIGAIADFYDNILESDETNNALVGNQITVVGPDLTMAAVSGPANAGTGAAITVSNTVAAASSAGNPSGFSVGIYLSVDDVITASDTRIGYRTVSSLASGASSTADTAVTIPTSIAAGTYYLGAIADWQNSVYEFDETNNALAGNQITIVGPDLTTTEVSAPESVRVGDSMTMGYTVKNGDGGGSAGWSYVGLYLSTDNVITTSDIRLGYYYVAAMAAGAATTSQNTVTVPSTLAPGTYYIGAIADYANNVAEPDETNNALAGSQITVIGPDLTISSVSAPADFPAGGSVAVTATVTASADGADVSQGFSVCLYLSQDTTITESDTYLGEWSVTSLAAGQSSSATTTVTVPSSLTFGATYYVGAVADCRSNYVKESDETNNARAGNAVTVVGPDLVLSGVSGPATAAFGEQVAVTTTVTNATEGVVPGTFYVHIFLSDNSTITSSDTYIGSRVISGMGPGASSTEATTVTIPTTLKRGTYYIGAIVDYLNSVNESDETNNALTGNTILIKR